MQDEFESFEIDKTSQLVQIPEGKILLIGLGGSVAKGCAA